MEAKGPIREMLTHLPIQCKVPAHEVLSPQIVDLLREHLVEKFPSTQSSVHPFCNVCHLLYFDILVTCTISTIM